MAEGIQPHVQDKGRAIQERQADRVAQRTRENGRFAVARAAARYTALEVRAAPQSTDPAPKSFKDGWRQGSRRASLIGDVLIAIIVAAVTATVSVPVWEWLLGLQ